MIPVTAMPLLDPGERRIEATAPEGATIAEIVAQVLPGLPSALHGRLRVSLANDEGRVELAWPEHWGHIRPRCGARVLIRMVPGGDNLGSVLMVAVTIAAYATGAWVASAFPIALGNVFNAGAFWGTVTSTALTIAGGLLINRFLGPDRTREGAAEKPVYQISGWRNQAQPMAPIPAIAGRHRIAPVYAGQPYVEIVGDEQFVRALFLVGYGPVAISDIRIGDTPISNFDDVEIEVREGYATDEPVTIYDRQIVEEQIGTELVRPLPRDDAGNVIAGPATETPVIRFTAADATECNLIFAFPGGIGSAQNNGSIAALSVQVRIRTRLVGDVAWATTETLTFSGKKLIPLFRQHRFSLLSRGRHEIEVTRMTDERTETRVSDRIVWQAIQSYRPEYPVATDIPVALIAARVRATFQLNGQLDTLNCIATRVAKNWDAASDGWVLGETRNPASQFRWFLESRANIYPIGTIAGSGLFDGEMSEWWQFCADNDLKYDRVHDYTAPLWEVLSDIARAGRAAPRREGDRWGVIIDRPDKPVIDHINDRNSRDLTWRRGYIKKPDGLRVTFLDETADYQTRERIIPWPGHAGEVEVTEELSLPGKVDPDEIYREAYRHMLEVEHRGEQFTVVQDRAVGVLTRGDRVRVALNGIVEFQAALRVIRRHGSLIIFDGQVPEFTGLLRAAYIVQKTEGTWESVVVDVEAVSTERSGAVLAASSLGPPAVGTLVMFGPAPHDWLDLIVTGTESGDGMTTVVHMTPAAPLIDTLLGLVDIPAWDGRVGEVPGANTAAPDVPVAYSVYTHFSGSTGDGLTVLLRPGTGSAVPVATFEVQHRLDGAGTWETPVSGPAGAAGIDVTGYSEGDTIELQWRAISEAGVASAWSSTWEQEVGTAPSAPTGTMTLLADGLTTGYGSVHFDIVTPPEVDFDKLRIYRATASDYSDEEAIAEITRFGPAESGEITLGDPTRVNGFANPGFDSDTVWNKGGGWAIGSGVATKTPGSATNITQTLSAATAGQVYRFGVYVSGRTAGTLHARMAGGATVLGANVSANGMLLAELTATAAHTIFGFGADSSFDGSIDNAVCYLRTASCLAQGKFYWRIKGVNQAGIEGAPLNLGFGIVI